MKALAALLLCSCAPVLTEIPASLPLVTIDTTLRGPVISREAAELIARRREMERARWATEAIDQAAKTKVAEMQRDEETKRANAHTWWAVYGGPLAIGGTLVGAALGAVVVLLSIGAK